MRARTLVVLVTLTTVVGMGCSKKDDSEAPSNSPPSSSDAATLYQQDLADLANFDSTAPTQYDADHNGIFTKIFGGTDAASVQQYYQSRVKVVITQQDLEKGAVTANYDPTSWNQKWEDASGGTPGSLFNADDGSGGDSSKTQIGALNIGTEWWLKALVQNVQLIINYQNNPIVVDSSRVGIVLLGPGYTAQLKVVDQDGNFLKYVLPPATFRQSILMHEARHSDCTGGLSQEQLQAMINATDAQEYEAKFPSRACGHLHVICPSSMTDFAGLPACDAEQWGAYAVGAVFLAATLGDNPDEDYRTWLDAQAADSASRFIGTAVDGLQPDMSSSGVLSH